MSIKMEPVSYKGAGQRGGPGHNAWGLTSEKGKQISKKRQKRKRMKKKNIERIRKEQKQLKKWGKT